MHDRGPDGKGEWYSEDDRVGLGHRRLAIIDLSDDGAQPMISSCGRYVISYNGEIYNYRALRAELEQEETRFYTDSDTEVLLAMFARYGTDMFARLRGMYAIAIWDKKKRRLLLARDPYGIKPLYYADDGWTCRVASQVMALRAGGQISDDPEPAGQVGFLLFGSVPEPFTCWREIRSVPAGSYLWVDRLGAGPSKIHFDLPGLFSVNDEVEKFTTLAAAIKDSVQHHLVADVPIGAFLSAGVDSSVLVSMMTQRSAGPVKTVTIGFEEFQGTDIDEVPLAEQIAAAFHTEHSTRLLSREEFEQDLPTILSAMDQPSIDGVNTWFASKACAEIGLKVAISGLGGDEVAAGYPSFSALPKWQRRVRFANWIPGLGILLRAVLVPLLPAMGINVKAAGMVEYAGSLAGGYLLKRGLFMPWELSRLVGRDLATEGLRRLNPIAGLENSGYRRPMQPEGRISVLEQSAYLRNQLLRDTDWASMAHSLEVRVPFVDRVLQRYMFQSGTTVKKAEIAGVSGQLPTAIVSRRKTGFTTPVGQWIQNSGDVTNTRKKHEHWARNWARSIYRQTDRQQMRILALMTEAFGALGGIQKFNRDWLYALAGLDTVEEIDVLVRRQATCTEVPVRVSQRCPALGKTGFVISALRQATCLASGDLIICGHIHLAPLAIAVAKISGASTWLHMHGVEAWSEPSFVAGRSVRSMSLISNASRFTRGKVLDWSDVNPHLVKVLPNVVDEKFTPGPVSAQLKTRLGLTNEKVLLTVGRLASDETYKGQDRVIRALPNIITEVPDVMYLVVGEGDDRPRLQSLAEALSVDSHVQFLGHAEDEELIALYRLADLFVMPSEGEGFGIVYLEAMACGCPALGLDAGGSIDALASSPLGHVCNDENMSHAMVHLLKNSSHIVKCSKSVFSSLAFAGHVSAVVRTLSTR